MTIKTWIDKLRELEKEAKLEVARHEPGNQLIPEKTQLIEYRNSMMGIAEKLEIRRMLERLDDPSNEFREWDWLFYHLYGKLPEKLLKNQLEEK